MLPIRLAIIIVALGAAVGGAFGESTPNDLQVRVYFESKEEAWQLKGLPLDIVLTATDNFEVITNPVQVGLLQSLGFRTETVHESVSAFYKSRLTGVASPSDMGGYKTLSGVIEYLDGIIADHSGIVSPRQSIGTTHEGRDIWAVKLSDNPGVDEDEPEVLYHGAEHAREVITPELLLTFIDHMTDNYGVDPLITQLVDEREIWVICVLNPDGYYHNEVIAPTGGGMWRKNRRVNGDGSHGVDLNRNYAYQWGYNNVGSSPIGSREVYRGPSPFSEPETQAVRDFALAHDLRIHVDWHAYANAVEWPWGYDWFLTPDDPIMREMADTIVMYNGYVQWVPEHTNGTNGMSIDWYYGEQVTKKKVFSFLFEVGTQDDGFWPDPSRIEELIAPNIYPLVYLTRMAGELDSYYSPEAPVISLPPEVDGGQYTVSWTHDDPLNPAAYFELYELLQPYAMTDRAESTEGWTQHGFQVVYDRSYSYPAAFAATSGRPFPAYLQTVHPYLVELGDTLRFKTWYDLEFYWDFGYVAVSIDGRLFTPIAGNITSNFNPYGFNPGHGITGQSLDWVEAAFDLSAYEGQRIWIRFGLVTDPDELGAGFYIDDIYPHLMFEQERRVAAIIAGHSYAFENRPLGVYYYKVRARDAQLQWSDFSLLAQTNVLAPGKGDPDLDGVAASVADLVLFHLYDQYGLPVFALYPDLQVGQTDFNCDGINGAEADLSMLHSLLLGEGSACYEGSFAGLSPLSAPAKQTQGLTAIAGTDLSYTVQVQSSSFEGTDSAWVDLTLTAGNASCLGFQFHLEYDTSGMTVTDIRPGDALSGWDDLSHSVSVSGTKADLRLAGVAWTGGASPDPGELEPGPFPKVLVRLEVVFDSEASLTRDIRFVWDDCFDNTLAVGGYAGDEISLERLALSRAVFDANLAEITGIDPRYGGADYTCGFGLFGATPAGAVDFTSGRVIYDASCCLGRTGNVDGQGDDEPTIGDVSTLIDHLFIEGGELWCLSEADVNQSGGANPTDDEITISDISTLIDYLFITGRSLSLAECL